MAWLPNLARLPKTTAACALPALAPALTAAPASAELGDEFDAEFFE